MEPKSAESCINVYCLRKLCSHVSATNQTLQLEACATVHQCWQACLDRLARSFYTDCLTVRVSQNEDLLRQFCMHYYQSVIFITARWFTRMLCSKYPLRRGKHMKTILLLFTGYQCWLPLFCTCFVKAKRNQLWCQNPARTDTHDSCAI